MVAAQQQIDRMGACGGGRKQHHDYWPGRAAATAISKARRSVPGGLVIAGPIGGVGPAVRKHHRHLTGGRSQWSHMSPDVMRGPYAIGFAARSEGASRRLSGGRS